MISKRVQFAASSALAQVGQSATSFLVTLGFAQFLTPAAFGVLSAFWLVWILVLSFNRALFSEQLLAQGFRHPNSVGYGSFFIAWILALACASLMLLSVTGYHSIAPGVIYIALFVGSDAIRYWCLAMASSDGPMRGPNVVIVETMRSSIALMFFLTALMYPQEAHLVWLGTLVGAVWPLVTLRYAGDISVRCIREYLRTKDRFEYQLALQYLTATGIAQILPMSMVPMYGSALFGAFRLGQSALSPLSLLGSAFQPSVIAYFSRVKSPSRKVLLRMVFLYFAGGMGAGLSAGLLMAWTGHLWLPAAQLPTIISFSPPLITALVFVMIGYPGGALIRVLRLGGVSLAGQIAGLVVSVISVVTVVVQDGNSVLFAWSLCAGTASTVTVTYVLLFNRLRRMEAGRRADSD